MSSFRVDTDSIKASSATIESYSSNLKMSSIDLATVRDSLDSSLLRVRPALDAVIKNTSRQSDNLRALSSTLAAISLAYSNTESDIIACITKGQSLRESDETAVGSPKDGSEPYDDDGSYGGSQSSIANHAKVIEITLWGYDFKILMPEKDLFDFVRSHPGYENLTDREIQELLKTIAQNGCGWVACANAIFAEYEGRPEDFEKAFGFPMYNADGDLNYDQLTIDFYLSTQGKYYVGDEYPNGANALYNGIRVYYMKNPDEFKAKYGIDLLGPDGQLSDEAYEKIIEERDARIAASDGEVVVYENDLPVSTVTCNASRMKAYLAERGVDCSFETSRSYTGEEVQEALDSGKTVVISAGNFDLYDENGNVVVEDVGGHAMVVTGVTEDGKWIVSSWGHKYYYDPNGTTPGGNPTTHSMVIYDIDSENS